MASTNSEQYKIEEFIIEEEPFYVPAADEVEIFEAAYRQRVPVLLKGPTGTGKTRFVEYMAWRLGQPLTVVKDGATGSSNGNSPAAVPLVTVACHEDLSASDLVGRYLLDAAGTRWIDGPLTRAVKAGGICYLDEVVEARKDTTVVIHPLADDRRILPMEKHGELLRAPAEFVLAMSYNPGYQSVLKELKQSTRQRFIAIEFAYPDEALESKIIVTETGLDANTARQLIRLAHLTRNLKGNGLDEGASTRLLVHAAKLMQRGIAPRAACHSAIAEALTDDPEMLRAINELASSIF